MPSRPPVHRPQNAQAARKHEPYTQRAKTTARGYGWQWQRLRAAHAMNHPAICVDCGHAGQSSEMHLDHRTARSKGGTDDTVNLQWLCVRCHSRKTAKEDGGFGRPMQVSAN
jgi:5-methylcytosine-specific restriction protein A